jgi:lactate permease
VFTQNFNPTANLALSALLAALPLVTVLVLLGVFRLRAHIAGLAGLAVALAVAIFAFSAPVGQAFDLAAFGAVRSLLIVLWITFNAIWIYNLTVHTGDFAVLRRSFAKIGSDRRVQAIVIAFSFGALIEALAGGGSPVAICAVMLIAIGFHPVKAAALALVANTAPVAFGGMGNPITVLGTVTAPTGAGQQQIQDLADAYGAMAGRQTAFVAILVPFALLLIADGVRGLRQAWPAALAAGLSFGVTQLIVSNFIYKLTDIAAALVSAAVLVAFTRIWKPREALETITDPKIPVVAGGAVDDPAYVRLHSRPGGDSAADITRAFLPYAVIVLLFAIAQIDFASLSVKKWLAGFTSRAYEWPGLDIVNPAGKAVKVTLAIPYLESAGTLLLLSGVITVILLRINPLTALGVYGRTLKQFGWAILTILAVFGLAAVMQYSGQITTLGLALAKTGALFAFLAPVVGWLGVAITGTDAGSNALFGGVQTTAAGQLGASGVLFGAANSSGGVAAKMISPQNLAIGAAATDQPGIEGELFRRVVGWSALMLLLLCILVYLQSTPVLGWMVP